MDSYITLKVKEENLEVINEMLPYVSEYIKEIIYDRDNKIIKVRCDEDSRSEVENSIQELEEMVTNNFFENDKINSVIIKDWTNKKVYNKKDVFAELKEKSEIYDTASGAFAYNGLTLKIFNYFLYKIDEYAKQIFNDCTIKYHRVPSLYSLDGYQKGGYFDSFPHHIMFETTCLNNLDNINKFSEAQNFKEANVKIKKPSNVLRTASCAPIYKYLENKVIDKDEKDIYIVIGTCFRNEADNIKTLSRLNEFTMKEYVFVGDERFIEDKLDRAMGLWEFWADTFSLNSKIETATDSFFANNYKRLKLFQVLGKSKIEFKCLIPNENKYISCSSKNYHRTHFSSKYNICYGDKSTLAQSACFAFGIDRLTFALLSQKGVDIELWDENTIEEINKYVELF